ncbi:hypothetical protein LSAT2_005210 [Lamellibrachia satsuma]|nr:hypothetical protein LSAT2_005210 [Lamellibrachia satsuma]
MHTTTTIFELVMSRMGRQLLYRIQGSRRTSELIRTTNMMNVATGIVLVTLALVVKVSTTGEADTCASKPCLNGGTCTDAGNSRTCACPAGYNDDDCKTNIDDCAGNPCQNGGTCKDGVNTHTCKCAAGYAGANCDKADTCAANPCLNGGTCTDAGNSRTCACPAGYNDGDCKTNIDDCAGNPCKNGGTCKDGVNTHTCKCAAGYVGANCDKADPCASTPCKNGHTCTVGETSYTCACPDGYSGDDCKTNPCTMNNCLECNTLPKTCLNCSDDSAFKTNGSVCAAEDCVTTEAQLDQCSKCKPGYIKSEAKTCGYRCYKCGNVNNGKYVSKTECGDDVIRKNANFKTEICVDTKCARLTREKNGEMTYARGCMDAGSTCKDEKLCKSVYDDKECEYCCEKEKCNNGCESVTFAGLTLIIVVAASLLRNAERLA